jgi:hypothetical protein
MVFTPYTIDTVSSNTSYTVVGLNPGKQYNFQVTPKNSIGSGPISTAITTTMAAQATSSIPSIVQHATFRSDNPAPASITLSLPNVPSSFNSVWVFFNGYGVGGTTSNAIVAPAGATLISGPNYDSAFEVTWCWQLTSNLSSNSFTFTNFDNTDNAGWKIIEVANGVTFDTNHGPVTSATTTAITWPLVAPASNNVLRLSLLSIQFPATIGSAAPGSVIDSDSVTTATGGTGFHQGVLMTETVGATTGNLAIANGTLNDVDTYLSVNIYGAALPAQVTNLVSSVITATGVRLTWSAVPGATSYTILYEGGGISTFTVLGAPLAATSSSITISGLIPSTTYSFEVFASNPAGQGPVSSIATIATLAIQAIQYIQSASIAKTGGAIGITSTLTATFGSAPIVGNTLAFFYFGFADTINSALTAPAGSSNGTAMFQDDGTSTDPIGMFWTQPVTSTATNYSFGLIDDNGSLIVVEMQGVTSVATPAHGGSLVSVDGASGHVIVPVAAPGSTPAITLVAIHMVNTVDSWGLPPANMALLKGITGNSSVTPTFHGGAVFSASSAVTGSQTIPYSLAVGTQVFAPTYISVAFIGSGGVIPPGQVVVTAGTTTSSSQVLTWTLPTGSPTSYTAQFRVTGQTAWNTFSNVITSLTTTITGLAAATSYDYQVIAFNGTQAGPSSAIVTKSTIASSPAQVTGLTLGTVTSTTQALSWTAPGGTVTSYTLQYKLVSASTFTSIPALATTSTVVTGLIPNSSYTYQVFALNGTNAGPVSTAVTGSTLALPAPGQPTNVTLGTPTESTMPISWTASTGTVTSYSVLYSSVSNTGPWTTLGNVVSTSTTVSGLTPSTVYYFEVIGNNGSTPSAPSTVVNATTAAASAPGQVVGLALGTVTSTSQGLSWSIPTGTVTSYTLQFKITGAGSFTAVPGILTNSYVKTGLAPSTSYTYQVFALNTTVAGSASTTIANTTLTAQQTTGSQLVTIGGKLLVVGGKFVIS